MKRLPRLPYLGIDVCFHFILSPSLSLIPPTLYAGVLCIVTESDVVGTADGIAGRGGRGRVDARLS